MHSPHSVCKSSTPDVLIPDVLIPDVFIAGGGPAGLAAAIAAAQRGLSVLVADGMAPPIDKACGEGLLPDTIAALAQLDVDTSAVESSFFRGIRFLSVDSSGRPIVAEGTFPCNSGRGMRRTILHQLLLDRATALGVRFSWQTVVLGIESHETHAGQGTTSARSQVRTSRGTHHPRFIIGADGHQSRVRAWASLDRASTAARRIGLSQHFAIAPWSNHVEVYWGDNAQAYVTPVSSREICVAFVARRKFSSVEQALSQFPQLQQRLQSALPIGKPRGSVTFSRKLHRVTRGNIALVGDASGSVDAITGEGLGLCFRQALALGDALHASDLRSYQQAHAALRRLPSVMARALMLMDSSPRLRNRTFHLLQRHPQLFEGLLSLHIGEAPVGLLGSSGLLATGARILAG